VLRSPATPAPDWARLVSSAFVTVVAPMMFTPAHSWSAVTTMSVSSRLDAHSSAAWMARSNSIVSQSQRSESMLWACLSMEAPSTISTKPFLFRDRTSSAFSVISSSIGCFGKP